MRAVIVGGGIAGLTAAHALIGEGLDVVVLEQAPVLEEIGAGINFAPNATLVFDKLGLLEPMREVSMVPPSLTYRRWSDGEVIARRMIGPAVEQAIGAPYLQVHRADVQRVLSESLPAGVIRLAAKVVGVEQTDTEAAAILEDGARHVGDVLIAADGIRSRLRSLLFEDPTPSYSGNSTFRTVVPREDLSGLDVPECSNWIGPGAHVAHYWLRGGAVLNIVGVVETPLGEDSWVAKARPGEFAEAFKGWNDRIVSMLGRATVVLKRGIFTRHPLEQWSVGRVVFMGDSAHAMTPFIGQGAAQAILDAAVLSRSLLGVTPDDVPRALTSFGARRRDIAMEAHRRSTAAGARHHLPDGPLSAARDEEMRLLATHDPYLGLGSFWRENVYLEGEPAR
jgi:salicylate hydroxylase